MRSGNSARNTLNSSIGRSTLARHAGWITVAILLSGCGGGGGSSASTSAEPPTNPATTPNANQAPQITSSRQGKITVKAGDPSYEQARASDADGDTLTFTIENKPAWSTFDTRTGVLRGNPDSKDVGTYSGIVISVSDGNSTTRGTAFEVIVDESGATTTNRAPTLSGTAPSSVNAGSRYTFRPTASGADGDTLTFSVQNLPAWAGFDTRTGALSGTPGAADIGLYSNSVISVSGGSLQTSGPAFRIEVTQIFLGSATLSWTVPTQNMDGSILTDLAGFKLHYGTTEGNYTEQITVDNPGISTYVVDNLATDTFYFVATAYNAFGVESPYSGVAVKTIQ